MKKTKIEKGITLIALIITVVVLMILATVAITSIQNDGIIAHAQNAKEEFENKQAEEQSLLNNYLAQLEEELGGGDTPPAKLRVTDVKNTVLSTTSNTEVYDEYDNKIVVPAGFMIKVDDTTNNADDVTEGIVIEDGTTDAQGNATATTGNQFVWIPCGAINHLDEEGEEKTSNITLGRYSWSGSTGTLMQPTAENLYTSEVAITSGAYNYTEYQSTSSTSNAKARNINDFYESVMGTESKEGNGGYYLGRYEAGVTGYDANNIVTSNSWSSTDFTGYNAAENEELRVVCKSGEQVWNYVTQKRASSISQGMYPDGYKTDGTGTFSSDLINSYAWDTAIIFIQTFGTKSNSSTYADTIGKSSVDTTAPQLTGTNILDATSSVDEQLNIYDMAGNCSEWSTETHITNSASCTFRGGRYESGSTYWTGGRVGADGAKSSIDTAFRPLLYVGLTGQKNTGEMSSILCTHKWIGAGCVYCESGCGHPWSDELCLKVDDAIIHHRKCSICGVRCPHEFENGFCGICGVCETPVFEESVCTNCGFVCQHNMWEGNVCAYCGFVNEECIAEGTLITLANGEQVTVENLTGEETLLVWNMLTGRYEEADIAYIISHNDVAAERKIIHLYFSDGTDIEIISDHGFYDLDLNKIVYINEMNYEEYIGDYFVTQKINYEKEWNKAQLTEVEIEYRTTRVYEVVTYEHLTCFTNGLLSISSLLNPFCNIFEVNPNTLSYDEELMAKDIEKYGLFTYNDFKDLIPEYAFNLYHVDYLKVALGKGLTTWDEINFLVQYYHKEIAPLIKNN